MHGVQVRVTPFVYVASFASDYGFTVMNLRFGLVQRQIWSKFGLVDFLSFLDYMLSFDGCCRQKLVMNKLRGCLPLFSGDLLLTTGHFHAYFLHQTLKFSELQDITAILTQYPGVSDVTRAELLKVATPENVAHRDRTVITWRIIVNHRKGCVETPAIRTHGNGSKRAKVAE